MKSKNPILLAVAVTALLGLVAAMDVSAKSATAGGLPGSAGRPTSRSKVVQWYVVRPPRGRYVRIGTTAPWCPGNSDPRPEIGSVRERDTQQAVILTARLIHRARRTCAGVELLVEYVVLLRQPLGTRPLYDGSQHPPVRRWPRRRKTPANIDRNNRLGDALRAHARRPGGNGLPSRLRASQRDALALG